MTDATETHELEIVRVFDAPRELVFRCMIEPEHLTHFWGPVGMSTPLANITVEPRPGGRFETTMVNDETGEEYPTRGVFVEVTPPERLVWTEPEFGITNTSTFTDLGDGRTEVRIHQTDLPEMFTTPEARAGFESSLDKFAAYLATL
jgi:uncharacterized protein YndB with AHSA1/START domain